MSEPYEFKSPQARSVVLAVLNVIDGHWTADGAKAFCTRLFGTHAPDGSALANVDWTEVADAFNEDLEREEDIQR